MLLTSQNNVWGILYVSWAIYLCSVCFWWGCFILSKFLLSSFACRENSHPHCAGGEDFTMCLKFGSGESSPSAAFYSIIAQWQVYGKSSKNSVKMMRVFWICTHTQKKKKTKIFQVTCSYLQGKVQKELCCRTWVCQFLEFSVPNWWGWCPDYTKCFWNFVSNIFHSRHSWC